MSRRKNRRNGTEEAEACPDTAPQWFALRTRSRCERTVYEALAARSTPAFLPLYSTVTRWSDREKTNVKPLFPGYVFVRAAPGALAELLQIAGVVSILPSSLRPCPIPSEQIESVQRVLALDVPVVPCPHVAGDAVTIETGALAGLTGVIVRVKGETRLVVSVEILHRAVSVEMDADTVKSAS
jgi:transcription termination/antitermination protein NusG